MRIALAQLSAGPDRADNLARALDTMASAKQAGAEVIAFPEVILDRFFPQVPGDREALKLAEPIPGPTTDAVAAKARELGLVTVFNLYELDSSGRRFDSSPVFDADGSLLGITRMVHITDYEGFHEAGRIIAHSRRQASGSVHNDHILGLVHSLVSSWDGAHRHLAIPSRELYS